MKNHFYFYAIASGIALIVHLIINWRQLFNLRDRGNRSAGREFRYFLVCLTSFFVTDILWGIFAELRWPRLLFAVTNLYFLAMALTLCAWTRYAVTYLHLDGKPRSILMWVGSILLVYFIVAIVANYSFHCFFQINADGKYIAGPMRHMGHVLLISFNALGALLTLTKLRNTKGVMRQRYAMVFVFGATMMLAIILQFHHPYLPLYALGCLFGCCFLHVFVVEDERAELNKKELLAHAYESQLAAERTANKAKSLFFSTVSHDIRTPLNAILGFSELLEQGVPDEGERNRYVSSICSSGKVLARLVNDILDLSKMESGKLEIINEPTDIPSLAREVIAACEITRARKSLALKFEICDMPWVNIDPQRIRQILFNLLSNAYKYTDRGTITVRVSFMPSSGQTIEQSNDETIKLSNEETIHNGTLTISVSDTGKGISKENLARILQPFVQLADKNHRDGTGLGLPICNRLAKLMGGELTVASEIDVGSTFTVTLHNVQIVTPPAAQSEQIAKPTHLPSRILVVDDSPVNRSVLKAMLAKVDVTNVTMAENGREALDILKADPDFDMVFSDLWMPEMDGGQLVGVIRADARLARLPVYLVTADVEARNMADAKGFTGVLLKPITLDKLRALFA